MKTTTLLRIAIAASAVLVSNANAQLFRAYLASDGNDGDPCTLQAPCRLLPAALNAVASGGEIWMLDSANYNTGPVEIRKSVSIQAVPGAIGSIVAINHFWAIDVSFCSCSVTLRNLAIGAVAGATPGTQGVVVNENGNAVVTIENCSISGLTQFGIYAYGNAIVHLVNSTLRNNGEAAIAALYGANVSVSKTQMLANTRGGVVAESTRVVPSVVTISDSIISGGLDGIYASNARVAVTRSTIEGTTHALRTQTLSIFPGSIAIGTSMVVNNEYGWRLEGAGSTIQTLGDNQVSGNGGSVGVLTPLAPQ